MRTKFMSILLLHLLLRFLYSGGVAPACPRARQVCERGVTCSHVEVPRVPYTEAHIQCLNPNPRSRPDTRESDTPDTQHFKHIFNNMHMNMWQSRVS